MVSSRIKIDGMSCVNCQNKIESELLKCSGIVSATASFANGSAMVEYDPDIISLKQIHSRIDDIGYKVVDYQSSNENSNAVGILIVIAALYIILEHFGILNRLAPSQLAGVNMSYGMLFIIGLVTSVHCIAMCGGINLSQCIPGKISSGNLSTLRPSFLYNLGRVISYTIIGGIVGAIGSAITFSNLMQGILKLIAGLFMVIMGLNMIFPWFRRFNLHLPRAFAKKINQEKSKSNSSIIVGLLNGLMPCGPLQAMQIYALSTGNALDGALSMLIFSLGTVPLMFGLGALSSMISNRFAKKMMTVGAILVTVLGLSMLAQGWSLSNITLPGATKNISNDGIIISDGVQLINSTLQSGKYPAITVQSGLPVKWTIDAPQGSINGCNNRVIIPEYNIEYQFKTGENIIEFTPTTTGKFRYSCWMGMIRGTITVLESDDAIGYSEEYDLDEPIPANVSIPTDSISVASYNSGDAYQVVEIELTDNGFAPAIVVLQQEIDAKWLIHNTESSDILLVPAYFTAIELSEGDNAFGFYPESDFDFSNGDKPRMGTLKSWKI